MEFRYEGDAHRALVEAYRGDEAPFPTADGMAFPPGRPRREEVELVHELLFPRCWNAGHLVDDAAAVRDHLDRLGSLFATGCRPYAEADPTGAVATVLDRMPDLRRRLKRDVEAAYKGDPAAKSYLEVIRSYPGFHAVAIHRVAHALYEAGAPEYARELAESAKAETGIDIHPGADVGAYFFVDHGTGVVVGETATVGDWVRLYQDVTLGVLHFEESEDADHSLRKGYERHPSIGDHVVIGAGAKVLGPITVGDHASIGANAWVTEDVPARTTVFISDHPDQERKRRH